MCFIIKSPGNKNQNAKITEFFDMISHFVFNVDISL